jgi:hypothetical protein
MRSHQKEAKNDLSAHAEHLRFIHASVLVASLVLLLASVTDIGGDLRRASDDINKIIKLNQDVFGNQIWLADYADEYLRAQASGQGLSGTNLPSRLFLRATIDRGTVSIPLDIPKGFLWTLQGPSRFSLNTLDYLGEDEKLLRLALRVREDVAERIHLKSPRSIGEVTSLWNELDKLTAFQPKSILSLAQVTKERTAGREPIERGPKIFLQVFSRSPDDHEPAANSRIWDFYHPRGYLQWIVVDPDERASMLGDSEVKDRLAGLGAMDISHALSGSFQDTNSVYQVRIPVVMRKVKVPAQDYLRKMANANWELGTFDKSFRSLSMFVRNLQSLSLEDVRTLIDNEKGRTGGQIEVAGLKIPASALGIWGVLVLVGLQIYFWLHFREFVNRLTITDKAWSFPWVALYPSACSLWVFRASAMVLPLVAAFALMRVAFLNRAYNAQPWIALGAFGLSLLVALCHLRASLGLRRKARLGSSGAKGFRPPH